MNLQMGMAFSNQAKRIWSKRIPAERVERVERISQNEEDICMVQDFIASLFLLYNLLPKCLVYHISAFEFLPPVLLKILAF